MGAPVFPLVVLFGLNGVDELDRSAFSVLLPDIRDHFDLSDAGIVVMVPIAVVAGFVLSSAAKFVLPDIAAAHGAASATSD